MCHFDNGAWDASFQVKLSHQSSFCHIWLAWDWLKTPTANVAITTECLFRFRSKVITLVVREASYDNRAVLELNRNFIRLCFGCKELTFF